VFRKLQDLEIPHSAYRKILTPIPHTAPVQRNRKLKTPKRCIVRNLGHGLKHINF